MKKEIRIALLAIVTLAVSIWGFKFISGKNMFSGDKTYYAIFTNVQDVNTATPIQINGFEVGTVISILPEPHDVNQIKIGFTVSDKVRIPDYTIAQLMSISPLGGKRIELIFDKMCDGSNCAENKSVLKSNAIGLLGSIVTKDEMDQNIETITGTIDKTLGMLGDSTSTDAVDVSIRNLSTTLSNFASISERLELLMSRSSRNMEKTVSNISTLTESLIVSNQKVDIMLDNLATVTNDLSKVKLSETISKTEGTITQAESSLKSVETTMGQATETLTQLKDMLASMNSKESTMGMLLNDKVLYTNIESTSRNLDLLLQDIRLNPRRYFKVFGKKVPDYEYPDSDPADGK